MTTLPLVSPHAPPPSDRLLVILSDIEMGAGGHTDDFPQSDWLGELILSYNRPPYDGMHVELVFNGDTFDLLKTSYLEQYPRHVTRDVAIGKLSRIAAAHPRFFEAMRRFLDHAGAERRAVFVVGNHDAELVFSDVQQLIRTLCGHQERILFPGFAYDVGRVHIEHGSQHDPLFRVEADQPLVEFEGRQLLNISWGAAALLDTVMEWQPLFAFHERLRPREQVLELMPEFRELLTGTFWRYWTRDYWKGYFGKKDPTRNLSWSMAKELVWRFSSKNSDVTMERTLLERLRASDEVALYVVGHRHDPAWVSYGDRRILQSGCLRNEFMIVDQGKGLRPMPRVYVEAYLSGGRPVRARLVDLEGPEPPAGYVPDSIFDVLPKVKELLEARDARTEDQAAMRAQEKKEQAERGGK